MIEPESYKIHESLHKNWSSYVYGEISSRCFFNVLNKNDCENKNFIDIGSGTGNLLIALTEINHLKLHGIEIDENRYKTSEEKVEKEGKNEIELIHGDFNDLYLGNYDIVYCCNCIFEEEDNIRLYTKIANEFKGLCFLFNFDKILVPFYIRSHVIETTWVKQTMLHEFIIK